MRRRNQLAARALRKGLTERFGDSLRDVIVFGSVARNEDTDASDVDVAVLLDLPDGPNWETEKTVRSVAFEVELSHDVVFDVKVLNSNVLETEVGHTPFVEKVLTEGVRP